MHPYEAAILGRYARTLIASSCRQTTHSSAEKALPLAVLVWLSNYRTALKVPSEVFLDALSPDYKGALPSTKSIIDMLGHDDDYRSRKKGVHIPPTRARRTLQKWSRTPAPDLPARVSQIQRCINSVVASLALPPAEAEVLGLLMRINSNPAFCELVKGMFARDWDNEEDWDNEIKSYRRVDITWSQVSKTLRLNATDFARVKARNSLLRQLGLVSRCRQDAELSDPILQLTHVEPSSTKTSVIQTLLGRQCRPSDAQTNWADFDHLGTSRDVALRLLKGALKEQARGVVVLLHGPPGTGKTAFAQTLIHQAGAKGWMVGESDHDGDEADREARLSSLLLASALSRESKTSVLILDEADDVFNDGAGGFMAMFAPSKARDGSKIFMNKALEDLSCPTILIVNEPGNLGEAILRRMSLSIEIKTPNVELSARIAGRVLARQKLKVAPETLWSLAENGTPPAVMALSARAAKLSGGGAPDLIHAARSVTRTLDIKHKPVSGDIAGMGFDPAFANADCDLSRLADQAVACGNRALSFCLYGLPGTGKSAFARWIAGRMGMDVIEKRASDLLGMYVGQSEKNIARAFEEAADTESFLIFDEVDSLLADRSHATKSWEVSQVNEMLTWMERHPLPFAATTNLMKGLDPAALRRFLFKAEFKPITPDQACALFARTFGIEAPAALANLDLLTPGDFAVVARKAQVLALTNPRVIFEALQTEVALKPGASRVRVGF
jgi:transitional endoplasmic reticulum ATPase